MTDEPLDEQFERAAALAEKVSEGDATEAEQREFIDIGTEAMERLEEFMMEFVELVDGERPDDVEALADRMHGLADELEPALSYVLDERIYEHATLVGPAGQEFRLTHAYVWAKRMVDGDYNVDILIREVPGDIDLSECRLRIENADGVPLHEGELRDEGNRQDGLGTICVQLEGRR